MVESLQGESKYSFCHPATSGFSKVSENSFDSSGIFLRQAQNLSLKHIKFIKFLSSYCGIILDINRPGSPDVLVTYDDYPL